MTLNVMLLTPNVTVEFLVASTYAQRHRPVKLIVISNHNDV